MHIKICITESFTYFEKEGIAIVLQQDILTPVSNQNDKSIGEILPYYDRSTSLISNKCHISH